MHFCIIDAVRAYLYQTYPSALPGDFYQNACESLLQYTVPADVVYRIEKYIYCLPDSGRAYYQAYSRLLVDSGYISKTRVIHVFFSKFILILKIASTSGCMWMILLRVHGYMTSSRLLSNLDLR